MTTILHNTKNREIKKGVLIRESEFRRLFHIPKGYEVYLTLDSDEYITLVLEPLREFVNYDPENKTMDIRTKKYSLCMTVKLKEFNKKLGFTFKDPWFDLVYKIDRNHVQDAAYTKKYILKKEHDDDPKLYYWIDKSIGLSGRSIYLIKKTGR